MVALYIFLVFLSAVTAFGCLSTFFIQLGNNDEPSKLMLFLGCANFFFLIYNSIQLGLFLSAS